MELFSYTFDGAAIKRIFLFYIVFVALSHECKEKSLHRLRISAYAPEFNSIKKNSIVKVLITSSFVGY